MYQWRKVAIKGVIAWFMRHLAEADLRATGNISGLTYGEGEALAVSDVELIPAEKRPKA